MYEEIAKKILEKVSLPRIKWEQNPKNSLEVTVSFVCPYRKNVGKFFFEMMSRWLIPGKQLDVATQFSTDFSHQGKPYVVCEIVLLLESGYDFSYAKQNFPFLEREILMGAQSSYHAMKILEMKGLTLDEKTALTQEKIAEMVRRFPQQFDYDIFSEMQHFLIISKEAFKAVRRPSEITRIIFILYRFRKILEKKAEKNPTKRHLRLKLKKTLLHTPFGAKEVLSIFVGLNFLKEHELFEERHFISALSHFIPNMQSISGSYYAQEKDEQIHTFYLEVEKGNQESFSREEIQRLQRGLSAEIRSRVEQLVPPIFMPRNEEEVMRNILILNQQLKYLRDIPQMIISFDEQTDTELSFTVVLVRIVHPDSVAIRALFEKSRLADNLAVDRVKVVGRLRRKYPKEASVLRVRLPVEEFLRADYSVDLFRTRLQLVKEIESALGEVRDYNGGMISKQSENFTSLKREMGPLAAKHSLLLQNFFHAIFPVQLSTTLDPKLLKILFSMLLEMMKTPKERVFLKSKKTDDNLFVMMRFQDFSTKQKIFNQIETLELSSNELLSVQIQIFDSFYLGFLCFNSEEQKAFLELLTKILHTGKSEKLAHNR